MAGETNPHHIVDFALVPVGGRPKVSDGRRFQMVLGDSGFQPEVNVRVHGIKLVDDLKTRLITEVIDAGEVSQKIEAELLLGKLAGLFDFTEMGRLTLAGHWKERTPREQQEFVPLFTALLERSYLSSIENYAGEKITFLNESVSGPYAQVRSRITTDRRVEISIDYRLIDNGTRWVVYDVVLDGVSLVSNYRSQFNSIIRTSSFADLLTKLRNKEIAAHVVPRIGRGGS